MIVGAAVAAGTLVAAVAYVVAGAAGLLMLTAVAGVLVMLAARLRIARWPARQAGSDQVGRVNAAFSSYWRIENTVSEGLASRPRFDAVTRPMLTRLAAALLANRRRVDLVRHPDAARLALGDEVWALLDPARSPVTELGTPEVTVAALSAITRRLEEL